MGRRKNLLAFHPPFYKVLFFSPCTLHLFPNLLRYCHQKILRGLGYSELQQQRAAIPQLWLIRRKICFVIPQRSTRFYIGEDETNIPPKNCRTPHGTPSIRVSVIPHRVVPGCGGSGDAVSPPKKINHRKGYRIYDLWFRLMIFRYLLCDAGKRTAMMPGIHGSRKTER